MSPTRPDGRALSAVLLLLAAAAAGLVPDSANACACGCGVFGVGTASLFPNGGGDTVFLEDDILDQTTNWSGTSKAPAADNDDKKIETNFANLGWQHMFNRRWGFMAELPIATRAFTTTTGSGAVATFHHTAQGDLKLMGMYTGLSEDMSTGLLFGVKVPSGDWTYKHFDRDTEIGTGSTDLLLGGYHLGGFGKSPFGWYVQGLWDQPFAHQGGYRPGAELNMAAGVWFEGWTLARDVKLTPIAQVIGSVRGVDRGPDANPEGSGYERALIGPALELSVKDWRLYGDAEIPVYQRVNGNQLVSPAQFKLVLSRNF
jgi:hypothetical protein